MRSTDGERKSECDATMFDPWRKNIPSNATSSGNPLWKKRSYLVCVSVIHTMSNLLQGPQKKKKKNKKSTAQSNLIKKGKESRSLYLICPLKCWGLFKRRAETRIDKGPLYSSLTPSHLIEFIPRYRNKSKQIHTY